MFFSVFWTAYITIVTIILSVVGDRLIRSLRQLRAHSPPCSRVPKPSMRTASRRSGMATVANARRILELN